jgi:5-methylcytosine-specific restriction endonuclease McrA
MTLTLDAAFKPLALVPVREAVSRLAISLAGDGGEVSLVAADELRRFRSQHLDLPAPLIISCPGYVELNPAQTKRVSRRVLFARDGYACQYCGRVATPGRAGAELTIDHVKPAHLFESRSEATSWENVTTACRRCNQRKGGRLPRQCGMWPRRVPRRPSYLQLRFAGRLNSLQRDYVCDYFGGGLEL